MLTVAQAWVVGVLTSATRRREAAGRARVVATSRGSTDAELRAELMRLAYMLESSAHLDEAVREAFGIPE